MQRLMAGTLPTLGTEVPEPLERPLILLIWDALIGDNQHID